MLVSMEKVLLRHSHTRSSTHRLWLLPGRWPCGAVPQRPRGWPSKPEIFVVWGLALYRKSWQSLALETRQMGYRSSRKGM